MSTIARSAKAGRFSTPKTPHPLEEISAPLNDNSSPSQYLANLSETDWLKLSSAVSLVRALIEYEIRECQEVFADNPNEESLNYWRDCLKDAKEAGEILTQLRANAPRQFA